MSGLFDALRERHQHSKEVREERHQALQERRGLHVGHDDHYGGAPPHHGRHPQYDDDDYDDNERRRAPRGRLTPSPGPPRGPSPGFASQGGLDRGDYASDTAIQRLAPRGSAPSGFGSQGGIDRGDFASDEDVRRMAAAGQFGGRGGGGYDAPAGPPPGQGYGRYDAPSGPPPGQGHGRYDAPSGPPPGQGRERYDVPSGPPPGRGYQGREGRQQEYESGGGPGYGGPDRRDQYGPPQTRGRPDDDFPQGRGRSQGNTPSGGFTSTRDGEDHYGSGYGGDRNEPPRRGGEAADYYNQQSGNGDRYAHLSGLAAEHGDDPELYRRATLGLQDRIQSQQTRRPRGDDQDDIKAHVDAHRKAYDDKDHEPMDADAIGAAAAMEAIKQTATTAKNAPAGAFQAGKGRGNGGNAPSQPGRQAARAEEAVAEEETATAARAGASGGGMQDKLMALAMSQAGKLFDKKNGGSSGDQAQGKAQAMQSAAATAMQLFTKYQSQGKLDSSDISSVMGLAMNMF